MELTPEQIAKIEVSKQQALAKLQLKRAQQEKERFEQQCSLLDELDRKSCAAAPATCRFTRSDGTPCQSVTVDKTMLEIFEESICFDCKRGKREYDLISKSECSSGYLVSQDALKWIKFATKNNPLQPGWKPMKLYLRKQVEQLSIDRFGSIEALEKEKQSREQQKFQRGLEKTEDILSTSAEAFRQQLREVPLESTSCDIENEKRKALTEAIDGAASTKRKTGTKRQANSNVAFFKELAKSLKEGSSAT